MSNPYQPPNASNDTDVAQAIAGEVRGLQIITFALVQGAVVVWAVMLFINKADISGSADIAGWLGIGMAVLMITLHLLIPPVVLNKNLQALESDDYRNASFNERVGQVLGAYRGSHIVACALLEGAAFMNAVFYVTGNWIGNVIAGAVLIGLIIVRFPTVTRMSFMVQDRMREVEMG